MDLRCDERFPFTLKAHVTQLDQPERAGQGIVVNISKSGIAIRLPFRLTPGDVVRIELDGVTVYGSAVHAGDEAPYLTGFEVERVLLGNSDLTSLLNSLLRQEETLPVTPPVPDALSSPQLAE